MIPQDLHYGFPIAANLIFLIFLFIALFWGLFQYRHKMQSLFAPKETLRQLLVSRTNSIYWLKVVAMCLAWLLLAFALMQPMGNGRYPSGVDRPKTGEEKAQLRRKAHEIIFLVDASESMEITDSRSHQSRLDYAKEIVDELVSRLTGETVSLYAFTSEVSKVVPPTMDYLFTRIMNRQIKINEGDVQGTSIIDALKYLRDNYFSEFNSKQKTVIILSDGGDTFVEGLPASDREQGLNELAALLGDPKALNLRVFTIGIGSKKGALVPNVQYNGQPVESKLDEELLQKISQHNRGRYYFANDYLSSDIATDLLAKVGEDEAYVIDGSTWEENDKSSLVYDLYFQLPLGLALVLLAFALVYPDTRSKQW